MDSDSLLRWVASSIAPGFEAPPYDAASARTTLEYAGRSVDTHTRLLQRWNGCYALQGSLHLFGARPEPPNQSLDLWNHPSGWRQAFGIVVENTWFFAESGFGDQFGYRDGKVVRLRLLDARIEPMAADFDEWLQSVFLEPQRWLSLDLFEACVQAHGPLPHGGHFGPAPTHVPGTALRAESLEVLPARDNLELRAASWSFTTVATRVGPFRGRG
jgi:hypothetical protein